MMGRQQGKEEGRWASVVRFVWEKEWMSDCVGKREGVAPAVVLYGSSHQ